MNLNRAQTVVLTTLISSVLVLSSGCQSGGFKPDLGSLAFWKKDDVQLAAQEIPPPSAHFSPDRGDNKSVAEANKQNLKNSVDAIIAEAKRNKVKPKDPSIKAYSLDEISPNIGQPANEGGNDFVGKNPIKDLKQSATTAISSTQDAIRQAGQLAQNPGSALSGLQQQSQNAASQLASGVSNGLTKKANSLVNGAAGAANNFLNSASNKVQQAANTVQNSVDNSFKPASNVAVSNLNRNPYLGALNNATSNFAGTAARTGQTAPVAAENVAKAVNNVTLPDSSAPQYKMVTGSETVPTGSTAGALQPLNQPVRTAANQATIQSPAQSTTYPSTPFGTIRPAQQSTSTLPAALQGGTSNFTPGSTKPLQPLR